MFLDILQRDREGSRFVAAPPGTAQNGLKGLAACRGSVMMEELGCQSEASHPDHVPICWPRTGTQTGILSTFNSPPQNMYRCTKSEDGVEPAIVAAASG